MPNRFRGDILRVVFMVCMALVAVGLPGCKGGNVEFGASSDFSDDDDSDSHFEDDDDFDPGFDDPIDPGNDPGGGFDDFVDPGDDFVDDEFRR